MITIPEKVWSSVATAAILGVGVFAWDYLTTDPELAVETRRIDVLEKIAAQNSVSNTQQIASIKSLSIDRALPAMKRSMETQTELAVKNEGAPRSEWSAPDKALWSAADKQIANAAARLIQ